MYQLNIMLWYMSNDLVSIEKAVTKWIEYAEHIVLFGMNYD